MIMNDCWRVEFLNAKVFMADIAYKVLMDTQYLKLKFKSIVNVNIRATQISIQFNVQ